MYSPIDNNNYYSNTPQNQTYDLNSSWYTDYSSYQKSMSSGYASPSSYLDYSNDGSYTAYKNEYPSHTSSWYYPQTSYYHNSTCYYNNHSSYQSHDYSLNSPSTQYQSNRSYTTSPENVSEHNQTTSPVPVSNKQKSNRTNRKQLLTEDAVELMNEWFEDHINNPYPQPEEKERLALLGGITVKQVTAWFSNRRNRSQNTKPKRMKRALEKEMNCIFEKIIHDQPDKQSLIDTFKFSLTETNVV